MLLQKVVKDGAGWVQDLVLFDDVVLVDLIQLLSDGLVFTVQAVEVLLQLPDKVV